MSELACPHCNVAGQIRRQYNNFLSKETYICLACFRVTRSEADLIVIAPPKQHETLFSFLMDLDPKYTIEFSSDKKLPVIIARQYRVSSLGTILPDVVAAYRCSCSLQDSEAEVLETIKGILQQLAVIAKTSNKGMP